MVNLLCTRAQHTVNRHMAASTAAFSERTITPVTRRRGMRPARSVRSRRRHCTFGIGRPLDSLANTVRTRPHYAYWPVHMAERLNVARGQPRVGVVPSVGAWPGRAQVRHTTRGPLRAHHLARACLGQAAGGCERMGWAILPPPLASSVLEPEHTNELHHDESAVFTR